MAIRSTSPPFSNSSSSVSESSTRTRPRCLDRPRLDGSEGGARQRPGRAEPANRCGRAQRGAGGPLGLLRRPGPSGSGTITQPMPSSGAASASAGSRARADRAVPRGRRARLPYAGASNPPRRRRLAGRPARPAGRGAARHELAAPAAALALELRARLRVSLHRVGGQLLDVGEDRLGEQAEHLRVEARARWRRRPAAARRPARRRGRRTAGRRVSGPGAVPPAERDVDLAPGPAAPEGFGSARRTAAAPRSRRSARRVRTRPRAGAHSPAPRARSPRGSRRWSRRARARSGRRSRRQSAPGLQSRFCHPGE